MASFIIALTSTVALCCRLLLCSARFDPPDSLVYRNCCFVAVKQRMRSVTNIQKITKAMKMVAASKMRVAQVSTEQARGLIVPLYKSLGDLPGQDAAHPHLP